MKAKRIKPACPVGRLSDAVRQAVRDSGGPRAAICRAAGIDEAQMSRFMADGKGLSVATLERLADVLDLEVVRRVRRARKETAK